MDLIDDTNSHSNNTINIYTHIYIDTYNFENALAFICILSLSKLMDSIYNTNSHDDNIDATYMTKRLVSKRETERRFKKTYLELKTFNKTFFFLFTDIIRNRCSLSSFD